MKRLLLSLLLASPILLHAQGSQVNTQSQKAVGMAGAGSALFIDETSIFYNPGALVKMDHNAIQVGASAVMYRSAFREHGSTESHDTKFQISPPFGAYATFGPKNSWWKAGIGVYTPFGGSVDWGKEWPGRFSLTHLSMRAIYIQPTLSFKLTEQFSVGGGFVYNIGLVDLGRALPVFYPDGTAGQATLKGTGTGMGYNVGVHYNLEDQFAISLSYRSKVVTKLEGGDATFEVPTSLAANFPNGKFDAELPLPSTFNIGIAFPLSDKVQAAIDGSLINYDIYKELVFDYETNTPVLQDTRSEKRYQNAFSGKAGINYDVNDALALRVGAGYVYTPVQAKYVYPETPDNNRIMAAGGVSYKFNPKWEMSAAYVFQKILKRTTTNAETLLHGAYETNIHAPGISLSYKW
ncbi:MULTISPECIES: OmpP1/FadL family transporter [Sphingobacterium]|uniref:Outer membrane protein transport protein n=1 Tax=Sphingobacterium hotanense TaxID=649196 RepID=A0ABT7NPB8_9SPHI|nr:MULTISPECIES: outer membrane protein transport protein [Sphingobacterium]MCT1523397.1 outer membrane protein transport protein [Sphingobacterium hotanense]MDM1049106.1 outer membrane protein transport protein [Sphingobacterium hotanense]